MNANSEMDNGTTRDDLLQRVELIESMIAEGRRFTTRHGWIFVLWGLVDLMAWSWQNAFPHSHFAGQWAWPICLVAGAVLTLMGKASQTQDRGYRYSGVCGRVTAVWSMMGLAVAIYVTSAMVSHFTWQVSYLSGLLMMVGLAHAISASILRWRVQGIVAAIWWAGGIAMFFDPSTRVVAIIILLEMCVGMIAFGLYAMMLERRHGGTAVRNHA